MIGLRHILCCLTLVCVLAAGGRAEAHASLIGTMPADGAVVPTAPASVRLRFSEPITPLVVRLVDANGVTHDGLHNETRDQTITVHLPQGLPRGTQVLSYRIISSDGHPVGGSLVFSIGAPTASPGEPVSAGSSSLASSSLADAIWLTRLVLYLGLFAGAGGAFFTTWIGREATTPASRATVRAAIGLGLAAAFLSVGLQGLDALGEPLSALLAFHPWREGLETSYGLTVGAAVLALACAWSGMRFGMRSAALIGLGGAGLALALSGHASAAAPQWLTRPSVFVHGTVAAFWVGALVPLALIVRDLRGAALPIVQRFSALAIPSVGVMIAAGILLSIVQIERPAALLTTDYGRIFLAKMAAVGGLLALAALNRQRLTPMLGRKDAGARYLIRSIMGEIGLAVVILGLVAAWRFTPPPRALMVAAVQSVTMHIHAPQAVAELSLSSGRVGPVTMSLSLMTGDFAPLDPKEVTVTLAQPQAGIEPMERRAVKAADGTWHVQGLVLPVPGAWRVRVELLISDFEQVSLDGTVEIRP
ncbi:copper resistance CopC/CopD family protein [Microvirga sp. TS319]|uniref:copper resistance CopC/CopD family protein n=1 Tax=Microvirga sp. TS319 TaxID=3241165 RepID=UPI00351A5606